jgi:DNA-binding winged helix-turn-helix (wHTH) protein/TolB-like protein
LTTPWSGARVRFGLFELDIAAGDLYREGVRVRLQEQPRQVLAALLERPGEVVTREQLRDRLWKNDTFVDFDHGLNTAIKKVRQALGDSAENPRFVETLARRGYRFIAPVAAVTIAAPAPATAAPAAVSVSPSELPSDTALRLTDSAAEIPAASSERLSTRSAASSKPVSRLNASRSRVPRWVPRLLFIIALAAILIGGLEWSRRNVSRAFRPLAHLAVLPFRVLSPPTGTAPSYLGVGIADAITTRLANVQQIALRPTSAVLPYGNQQLGPEQIGSALSVEHVLVGTIQPTDTAYRVSVQLVRTADGLAIWGQTYDLPVADLLRLQDTVAEQVVAALRLELTGSERARLTRRSTENPAAFDLYLRARVLLVNYTEANMRDAITRFEEALRIDPPFALARAGLATAYAWFSVRYAYESEASEWGRRAEQEAQEALREDDSIGEAHLAIANAAGTVYRGFDWNTVFERSSRALALDPSLDLAHIARARAFYHVGLFDAATREARSARVLNPTANIEIERLEVAVHLFGGEFSAAAEQASRLLPRTDAPAIPNYLGLAEYYGGRVSTARETLASARRGGQLDVRSQTALAAIEAAAGDHAQARTRADTIAHGPYMDHHVAYSLGTAYAQLGALQESASWLTKAADTGFPCYPWFARDPLLDPLRRDPAFIALLDRLRVQHDATRARFAGL